MVTRYDAVLASTSPSLKIDHKRAQDAINRVVSVYGSVENYKGLWIAAGTLGGQKPETAQRTRIYNQFLAAGIDEEQVRTIGGEDTMDKVRKIIGLAEREELETIGISTYLLHYRRFEGGLHFAKEEGLAPTNLEFKLIWSPTTPWTRWHKDLVYGLTGLCVEAFRLGRHGFAGSDPDHKPFEKAYGPVRDWSSDGEDIPMDDD